MCSLQKAHFKCTNGLKVRGQKDIPHKHESKENWSRYTNIRSSRFQSKNHHQDTERYYVIMNRSINQENITS